MAEYVGWPVALTAMGILAWLATFAVCYVLVWLFNRMRKRQMQPSASLLEPGEKRLAEMYASTRDIRIGGMDWVGDGRTGKLVLTDKRLLFCSNHEKRVPLSLDRSGVTRVGRGETGRLWMKSPTLVIDYWDTRKKKARTAQWTVPNEVAIEGAGGATYANTHTLDTFHDALQRWKTSGPSPEP